ncbi:MAG: PaaI family thioesterase [Caulobacterales bacterium]|jgi:uncharacterized protein (TIGR00369 family)
MADGDGNAYGSATLIETGPFAGWITWGLGSDPYETHCGPFCYKVEPDGRVRAAFQPAPHHLNGMGALHGGALMSFADFALFAIAHHSLVGATAVTLTCNSEFIAAGGVEGWVEADGEVIKETRSVIFVRGTLRQNGKALLAFSGVLKKLAPRA